MTPGVRQGHPVATLLERAVRAGLAPGAVAAWGRSPLPDAVAVGRARIGPETVPAAPDTWYDLASLTKPLVVATLCLLAFRNGELAPGTPLADVHEGTRGGPLAGLSIRQLLTHTSGLPDWLPLYALSPRRENALSAIADSLGEGSGPPPVRYSCLGFILLGQVLEKVGGGALERLFTDRVLRPLGLEGELGFLPAASRPVAGGAARPAAERRLTAALGADPERVPSGHHLAPDDGNARFLGGVAGNSGLFGTALGVYRLAREYLPGGGGLLRSEEAALATAAGAADAGGVRGLGWQLAASPGCAAGPALSRSAFGHTGFTGTSVWAEPARAVVMVLLANRHHPGHRGIDLHPLRRRFHSVALEALRS